VKLKLIIGSLLAGSILTLLYLLNSCYNNVYDLKEDKRQLETQKQDLIKAIERQNKEIEFITVEYEKRLLEYDDLEPRTIYIPADINMTRGNCNDVKNIIDVIRNIDF